jgi:hypothetical protein
MPGLEAVPQQRAEGQVERHESGDWYVLRMTVQLADSFRAASVGLVECTFMSPDATPHVEKIRM